MRTLIVIGFLMSIDAFADAKVGEKKLIVLLCHKPANVMACSSVTDSVLNRGTSFRRNKN
jgi:hypothetical protein